MSKQSQTSSRIQSFKGRVRVPGDKSISHRAMMLGGLAKGETIISGLLEGEDVLCTADAMRRMGARISKDAGLWRIIGTGGKLKQPAQDLDMGNSGTSTRLLMGLIAGHPITATFIGDQSLSKRPMKRVMGPLGDMGAQFPDHQDYKLPVTMKGSDALQALEYTVPVASAQVKSALILAGLGAQSTTKITENRKTRDHSEIMLQTFGAEIDIAEHDDGSSTIAIAGGQKLWGCAIDVPSDPSSAAFPAVAAAIIEGADIYLPHIGVNKTRVGLYDTLQEMGADITLSNEHSEGGEPVADMQIRHNGALRGITIPPERVPLMIDEFPILAVAASCAEGTTTMTGLGELRVKESDRLAMMAKGLAACGVQLEEGEDSLIIHGTGKPPKGGATIETAHDHRIAMSFLVLGCVSDEPITIDDASPIKTSFPDFIDLMEELGAEFS
jgi:3-phosphoshikimate 1-carboxyvinyltransferase